MFLNDSWESTLDTRTLQSWMSSSLIRSLIAYIGILAQETASYLNAITYTLAHRHGNLLCFYTRDKLRALGIEKLQENKHSILLHRSIIKFVDLREAFPGFCSGLYSIAQRSTIQPHPLAHYCCCRQGRMSCCLPSCLEPARFQLRWW